MTAATAICYEYTWVHYEWANKVSFDNFIHLKFNASISSLIEAIFMFGLHSTLTTHVQNHKRKKQLAAIPSTHSPVSRSEVLQCSCGRLQGVVVVTACEKREVEPHHLWLVQQLQPFKRKAENIRDDIQGKVTISG